MTERQDVAWPVEPENGVIEVLRELLGSQDQMENQAEMETPDETEMLGDLVMLETEGCQELQELQECPEQREKEERRL